MIMIYSASSDGKLFTDPKQHFYIDAELLQEKAIAIRTEYLLDQISSRLGYDSFDSLKTFLRCSGVTEDVLESWIISGELVRNLMLLAA